MKEKIVTFLSDKGLSCLESDESCCGDYRQWSSEAVRACSVVLPILTEHAKHSTYMPIEMKEAALLDDYQNRIVPICESKKLYDEYSFGLSKFCSAVFMSGELSDADLDELYNKIQSLLINRYYPMYRKAIKPSFVRVIPLWAGINGVRGEDASFENLYIQRRVLEYSSNGEVVQTYPDTLTSLGRISFIYGPAGSGKTQYLNDIASKADDTYLPITISCQKLNGFEGPVYDYLYERFRDIIGREKPYSQNNFARLVDTKYLLLLFDGMDEIAEESATRRLVGRIEAFYKTVQKKSALIFTSRNRQDANTILLCGKTAYEHELEMLSESDANDLIGKLFALLDNEGKENDFSLRVKALENEIKFNPLLLTQLAIIYRKNGNIPTNRFGILDAIADITLQVDKEKGVSDPEFLRNIRKILKDFAREKYNLLSSGRQIDAVKIFKAILKKQYNDYEAKADFLVEYLKNRAILIDGEFFHKMFIEYFTAVSYYDEIFGVYDELENEDALENLISHYSDPYWSAVIQLFLTKADSLIDENNTVKLYDKLIDIGKIRDYVLLFDTCRELAKNKTPAQTTLVKDILYKSAEKIYPPYGPLFYYVPEYELYPHTVKAAELLKGNANALALTRDVCFIFGQYDESSQVTGDVDGVELYNAAKPQLSGVRDALCELFFTGENGYEDGNDIYPRCFNVAEAKSLKVGGLGILGRNTTLFTDTLSLFPKIDLRNLNDIPPTGLMFLPHDAESIKQFLKRTGSLEKITGIVYLNSKTRGPFHIDTTLPKLRFISLPENIERPQHNEEGYKWHAYYKLIDYICLSEDGIQYFRMPEIKMPCSTGIIRDGMFEYWRGIESVSLSESVNIIEPHAFANCKSLRTVKLPDAVREIGNHAFYRCMNLTAIQLPPNMKVVSKSLFEECDSLETVIVPESVLKIQSRAFRNCTALKRIEIPSADCRIDDDAFEGCKCDIIIAGTDMTYRYIFPERGRLESGGFRSDDSEFVQMLDKLTADIKESQIEETVPEETKNEATEYMDGFCNRSSISERELFFACACLNVMLRYVNSQSTKRYIQGKNDYIAWILTSVERKDLGNAVHINYEFKNKKTVFISFSGFQFSYSNFPYAKIEEYAQSFDCRIRYDNIKKQQHAMTIYNTAKKLIDDEKKKLEGRA